ncbi:MAG TPA: acyl-CoA dehydrogenase family protein, partial [Burkholderiales bacterium]|nr:acyl-CoA dehydrogenase family protein [Burkholderiales bacterium]
MKVFERLDASLVLSQEEKLLLDAVKRLSTDKLAPRAAELDRTAAFPHANVKDINALGLNAMFVPEAYGGSPVSYAAYLACVRELSAACASTGIVWATTFHAMKPLLDFGAEEQKKRLLPRIAAGGLGALAITEPSAGSDATGMKTRFTPQGDHIVVDGGKTFITNGDVAVG